MSANTFVFDLAGVLLDWDPEPFYRDFFSTTPARYTAFFDRVLNDETQYAISAGEPMGTVLAARCELFPDFADAIDAWQTQWKSMLIGEIGGTVAALGELRERGHRTFALGNWSREEFDLIVDDFPFLQAFDGVLLSGDCGILKPDAGIYTLAEERFSLEPARTVFIDDRPDNVHAAISRGWNGIVFENPRNLYLTLMEYQIL
ncbi:MAG: HAD family phosphatase [Pseudomonadota bacterium]